MTTILLVEDNEPSRDALGRRLARRGYDVRAGGRRPAGASTIARVDHAGSDPDGSRTAGDGRLGGDARS